MAWTTPRSWTTGEVVTAAEFNTNLRDNELELHTFRGALVWQSAALNSADSTWQLITWDSIPFDTASYWNAPLNCFSIPTGFAGIYRVLLQVQAVGNGGAGRRLMRLALNESYAARAPSGSGSIIMTVNNEGMAANAPTSLAVRYVERFSAGDQLSAQYWQNSGSACAFNNGLDTMQFSLQQIGV